MLRHQQLGKTLSVGPAGARGLVHCLPGNGPHEEALPPELRQAGSPAAARPFSVLDREGKGSRVSDMPMS